MKEYATGKIRNVALVGHQDSGKTTVAEAMLFRAGAIDRMGKIEDNNTTMDTSPEEHERGISTQSSLAFLEHNDHKLNIVDTPGYEDFFGEVLGALDVVEAAVVVIRGDGGAEVGTDRVWGYLRERDLPTIFVINRMDKENADFDQAIASIRDHFGRNVLPIQLPIGQGDSFSGVVSLLDEKAIVYSDDGKGTAKPGDIPADMNDKVASFRREFVETAAETSEALMEKYLENDNLSHDEAVKGLHEGVRACDIFPVLVASAEKNIGVDLLLDRLVDVVPAPDEKTVLAQDDVTLSADPSKSLVARIFKNVSESHVGDMLYVRVVQGVMESGHDVFNATRNSGDRLGQLFVLQGKKRTESPGLQAGDLGAAVKLKNAHVGDTLATKANPVTLHPTRYPAPSVFSAISAAINNDEDKVGAGLNRLKEEDLAFEVKVDSELHQTLISGQGELHLEILTNRLKQRFGVEVVLSKPLIPYRETIRKGASAQGKYKKQTGGRGQYGDVHLKLEPMHRGDEFEFVDAIVGGVVPGKFIPAVEKGVNATMQDGVLAGYPMVDVKVTLFDGSYHNVDSSENAFRMAGSMAFRKAAGDAGMVLLEPIMDVEVKVPEEYMGDVMGDLSGRRGKIQGMEPQGRFTVVRCQVPQGELYRYSTQLRSMTQGRGTHSRNFSHYEAVPNDQAAKIIDEAKKAKEAGHA